MLKVVCAAGAALVIAGPSTLAADLKLVRKAPQAAVAVPFTWAGPYAGATLGWATGRSTGFYHGTAGPPPPSPPPIPTAAGAIAAPCQISVPNPQRPIDFDALEYAISCLLDPVTPGAVAGYNWQLGSVVAGLETDVGWIGRHSPIIPAPDGSNRWDQFGVTWTGHVRGRVGYAVSQCLPFVGQCLPFFAGGLGLAEFNVAHFRSDATGTALYSADNTRAGYTIGGGIELADLAPGFLRGWSFRGEYLYDHFNPRQYDWVPGMRYTLLDLTIQTLRGAAIYHFAVPR
jgi:outer membrane immunogenic protein